MSEGVEPRLVDAPLAKPAAQASDSVPRGERARLSGYRKRFGIVYLLLALVAGVAVGALIVEALREPAAPETLAKSGVQFDPSEPGEPRCDADRRPGAAELPASERQRGSST